MLDKLLRGNEKRLLKKFSKQVKSINNWEDEVKTLTDAELTERATEIRQQLSANPEDIDNHLPEVFALTREAAGRTIKQRHYDVQLLGGIALHNGLIAEMKTGEGKTLTATLAISLNAMAGKGVHVVTVNDYLAKRDAEWMRPVYEMLGLSVAYLQEGFETKERQQAYQADITYGTNSEFGFDYLRDHLVQDNSEKVQREFAYAIVDEVDSVLIDYARTPLVISGQTTLQDIQTDKKMFKDFAKLVKKMRGRQYEPKLNALMAKEGERKSAAVDQEIEEYDYEYDERYGTAWATDRGITKAEKMLGIDDLHKTNEDNLVNHLQQALIAEAIKKRDKHYTVVNGEVAIIDENTGRVLEGQRWANGLHQAVEAKEKVAIVTEDKTLATITYQNFFRLYPKLAGMTGTAATEAIEFKKIYDLIVVEIPTHKPVIRKDLPDRVYLNLEAKWEAVIEEIKTRHASGQPILVGTIAIEDSEYLSKRLKREGIKHNLLNAKPEYAEREGQIIARAGAKGEVTIATNMAGRGVDIKLGGDKHLAGEDSDYDYNQSYQEVKQLGGLFILGTERHESRRIDNQLRGRAGRQGDPGESVFFLSADDRTIRLFAGEKFKQNIKRVQKMTGIKSDQPLKFAGLTKMINNAQIKLEEENFLTRKRVTEYDDVVNEQRRIVYQERDRLLNEIETNTGSIEDLFIENLEYLIAERSDQHFNKETLELDSASLSRELGNYFVDWKDTADKIQELYDAQENYHDYLLQMALDRYHAKRANLDPFASEIEAKLLLTIIDRNWREQLSAMDYLKQGIYLRAFAQLDPIVAYRNEGYKMFQQMKTNVWQQFIAEFFAIKIEIHGSETQQQRIVE